ncbi:MAG TPA: hypothetical protein GX527_03415 [Clostridiaceae bacterium]|jgi:hypothetical protein|nr:hypothetical protein [Clostridiaceae bacterium]
MKMIIKDPNAIRRAGIESLAKNLGPIGMAYFLRQYDIGEGDYTKERKELLKTVSIEDIKKDIENLKSS